MPRILGIDSSLSSTGMCLIDTSVSGQTIRCATIPTTPAAFGGTGFAAYAKRIKYIADTIGASLHQVDLVAIEALAYSARGASAFTLPWLWGRIVETVCERDIQLLVVGTSQRAKYATGKGNAAKDVVMASAIRRWPEVEITSNDTADALIVAAIGCRFLGYPVDEMPKAHYADVMKKLTAA